MKMQRTLISHQPSASRSWKLETATFSTSCLLSAFLILFTAWSTFALNDDNPYSAIVGRNAFALKPIPPPAVATPPPTAPPGISLQGFTTILGRPQVLLKIKLPAKLPEPAKEQGLVMDVGQREGDVEVLEINVDAGIVKLNNQGSPLSLNIKDNADKPALGAALPSTGTSPLPGIGQNPVPGGAAPPAAVSGAGGGNAMIPSRPLRTESNPAVTASSAPGSSMTSQQQNALKRSPEENSAMMMISAQRLEQSGFKGPIIRDPRLKDVLKQ